MERYEGYRDSHQAGYGRPVDHLHYDRGRGYDNVIYDGRDSPTRERQLEANVDHQRNFHGGRGSDYRDFSDQPRGRASDYRDLSEPPSGRALDYRDLSEPPSGRASNYRDLSEQPRGRASDYRDLSEPTSGRASDYRDLIEPPRGLPLDYRDNSDIGGRRSEFRDNRDPPMGLPRNLDFGNERPEGQGRFQRTSDLGFDDRNYHSQDPGKHMEMRAVNSPAHEDNFYEDLEAALDYPQNSHEFRDNNRYEGDSKGYRESQLFDNTDRRKEVEAADRESKHNGYNDGRRKHDSRQETSAYNDFPDRMHDIRQDGVEDRNVLQYNEMTRANGHANLGFEQEEDLHHDHRYKQRPISVKRRSKKFHREKRSDEDELPRISFADGMKTLIHRRRSQRARQPLSEIGGRLRQNEGQCESVLAHSDEEDEKLPSNRNVKKHKSMKRRLIELQEERHIVAHDMANLLRDQVLPSDAAKLSSWANWKLNLSIQWQRLKNWVKSWIYELELWAGAFKVIEGHFGTSTVSYFRFLRWLMFLNFFMAIFMLSIVLLPYIVLHSPMSSHSFASSVNACASEFHFQAVYMSTNYSDKVAEINNNTAVDQKIRDFFQGTGWLENTILFIGAYYNKTEEAGEVRSTVYNMSLAYLFAVGVAFLLSFILLVKNSAKGLKQSASVSGNITLYCNKVFGAWDYCISESKTADLKHISILQDFKNELKYQQLQWKKESRTTKEKLKLYGIRCFVNVIVIGILGGALYLIFYVDQQLAELKKETLSSAVEIVVEFLPSITIMVLSVIVPVILNKVVEFEDYMPAFAIRITLIRTVLLRLASLGMLMISLYRTIHKTRPEEIHGDCNGEVNMTASATRFIHKRRAEEILRDLNGEVNMTASATNETQDTNDYTIRLCWETYVGQQIYKLVVLNFIVVIVSTIAVEFPRQFIYKKLEPKKWKVVELVGQQTFDLSKNVLDLVYLQTLCWLGLFFSPLIPAMCFIECFIFFYVKKSSLLVNCSPTQQYGTSKSNSLFMLVLLLSFFLSSAPIIYMLGSLNPSQGCGPFRVYSSESYKMFDAVTNLVKSFDSKTKDVFFFVGTEGFMAAVALCLCLLMYYFWMVGQANYKLSKSLREQLKVEGQDKQFLVARLNEAYAQNIE